MKKKKGHLVADAGQGSRALAVAVLDGVLRGRRSLSSVLPPQMERLKVSERALMQELCYGVLRWLPRLESLAGMLLRKPLRARDNDVYCLILLGLYQLAYMRIPAHAVVDETVAVARSLGKDWARAVVNGVLRNFQRRREELEQQLNNDAVALHAHPRWLINTIQAAWPDDWWSLLEANQQRPPMVLRVNLGRQSRQDYQQQCQSADLATHFLPYAESALMLEQPVDVQRLPGFAEGQVSIQDAAAQLAPGLLDLQAGQRVLDACAAPGGKSCHLLETQSDIDLVALDVDAARLQRVTENLQRLNLAATLICGDAADTKAWWDGGLFDRILVDAPCSATGVIRRHPDIKLLRQSDDIDTLVLLQRTILVALWPLLKPGGRMLYATCSVLPQENSEQVMAFLAQQEDAREIVIDAAWGRAMSAGRQILAGSEAMDGFYYACIVKQI